MSVTSARRGAWIVVLAALVCVAGSARVETTSTAGNHHSSVKVVTVRATSIADAVTAPRPTSRLPLALAAVAAIVLAAWFTRRGHAHRATIWRTSHGFVRRRGPPLLLLT